MAVQAPDWLHKVLDDFSTKKYRIEYRVQTTTGYKGTLSLSNHVAHGIIALWWLGADENRVREYAIEYSEKKLEDPAEDDHLGKIDDLEAVLGTRNRFNDLWEHYHGRLVNDYGGDLATLVQKEFPRLSAGLHNAALHGLIHLGYGLSVKSDLIACEGLSYMHYSHVPMGLVEDYEGPPLKTLGKGSKNIIDILYEAGKSGLYDVLAEDIKGPKRVKQISDWMLKCAITVYLKARRKNDFLLIHGVTSAWSLCHVLPFLLPSDKNVLKTIRVYFASLIVVYLFLQSPILDSDDEIVKTFPEIIKEAVAKARDEHIYKLIQVCYDCYQKADDKDFYLKAAHTALMHDLLLTMGGVPSDATYHPDIC